MTTYSRVKEYSEEYVQWSFSLGYVSGLAICNFIALAVFASQAGVI